jgi:gamma-butyrobetaine dioxygenase
MAEVSVEPGGSGVRVVLRDRTGDVELPALWLRQYSAEPSELDDVTGQRLFDPHLLPVDLAITSAEVADGALRATFSDGHASTYLCERLLALRTLDDGVPAPVPWRATDGVPRVHPYASLDDPVPERAVLEDLLVHGTVVLDGVPTEPGTILAAARRLGFVRETNFGPLFDVRSMPRSTDLAYRAVPLSAHTDNPYRVPVPGIQLLHCLVNETAGGLSSLVDGLAALEILRAEDPAGFDLLATVPVRFTYRDAGTEIVAVLPVVALDRDGAPTGLSYSPRLDEVPLLAADELRRYQAARQRLSHLLASPDLAVEFLLEPGQLMVFDNNRVLHGRTSFDPNEGLRHLQGCYIDSDGPRTRYRVLSRKEGAR